jgi:hypothetical protein
MNILAPESNSTGGVMVQSYDSQGKERQQNRRKMEGKMVWEGERNNTTGM